MNDSIQWEHLSTYPRMFALAASEKGALAAKEMLRVGAV